MVIRTVPQMAYSEVPVEAGTVQRTLVPLEIVTTGKVSEAGFGERIAMTRSVSTMSLSEIWVLPALSLTRIPARGSVNPPGPGCTGPGAPATALTGGVPALAAQPG